MNARRSADAIAAAITARDHDALMACYADDVVFHSPATAVQFRGKDEVGALMMPVLAGFERWERTFVLADGQECVFGADARVRGRDVQLAEFIRVDTRGLVTDVRIHGRPLAGIAAIAAAAAPTLAERRGRVRALLVAAASRGLPQALAGGDRLINRLAR